MRRLASSRAMRGMLAADRELARWLRRSGLSVAGWTNDGHLRGSGYVQLVTGTCSVVMSLIKLAAIGHPSPSKAAEPRLESETRRVEWGLVPGQKGEPQLAVMARF